MDETCAGVITWMHTLFSCKVPGLSDCRNIVNRFFIYIPSLMKSFPYDSIDMDFMNETSLHMVIVSMVIS